MNITVGHEECVNTENALRREWLETNGRGGYASSTIINCHTRKYHGMLVSSLPDPSGSFVLLSKVEASILTERKEFRLHTNKYPGIFDPTGHKYQESFEYKQFPEFTYRVGDIVLRMSVVMPYGENTVLLKYELLESERPITLRLRPLLSYRDYHKLMKENFAVQVKTFHEPNGFKIQPYDGMPPMHFVTNRKSMFYPGPDWYRSLELLKERRRGYPYQEDLFCPGVFELELRKGNDVILGASLPPLKSNNLEKIRKQEIQRRTDERARFDTDDHLGDLQLIGGQFLINNRFRERSVIAGYHWFGEWGRDTMIALPGLTFYSNRMDEGFDALETFARREKDGLLPNYIAADGDTDAYNSGDASLWYFWAIQEYLQQGGKSTKVIDTLLDSMGSIIHGILDGTTPYFTLEDNGLLRLGDENTQLTWMDANADGKPVTPRNGCPVEINALWYNALKLYEELCEEAGIDPAIGDAADTIKQNFLDAFWVKDGEYLADAVDNGVQDTSIRPNQVFAMSLKYNMVPADYARKALARVSTDLLTPYGLRTLSPANPAYQGRYEGTQPQRDRAYHQGTVWPWLSGHFGAAYLKAHENSKEAAAFLQKKLEPLLTRFPNDFGVAGIPEIYSGNPPHKPKGCINQAWSVAEVIRLNVLLKEIKP